MVSKGNSVQLFLEFEEIAIDHIMSLLSPVKSDRKEFLKLAASKLDLSDTVVMDIGCGDGRSCKTILDMFPAVKKVIGIDCEPKGIHDAISNNTSKQIEYEVANIDDGSSLVKWYGEIDRIISLYRFHSVKDRETVFGNIYHLLKPGGGAAILHRIDSPFYRCLQRLAETSKWRKYGEVLLFCFADAIQHKLEFSQYKKSLEKIRFKVILCEKEEKIFDYPSETAFSDYVVDKFPLLTCIPEPVREEFKRDYFSLLEEMNGRTTDGRSRIIYYNVMVLVKKD